MLRGMAAKPGKSADILDAVALLVVDMQSSFLDIIEGAAMVVERCGFAIEAARALGLRVLFTEQVPAKLGPTEPRLRALVPNARVFAKSTFSALQAEGLLEYLRRQGIYHLVVAGIEVPVCIYQTALHAVDSDLDVTVLSDCVTGRRLDDCLVTLEALTRAHCHLLPAEAVFYSMLGNAGHPLFPAFNALVKRYAEPGALDAAPPPPHGGREREPERRPAPQPDDRRAEIEPDLAEPEEGAEEQPYIGRDADGAPAVRGAAAGERDENESERTDDAGEAEGEDAAASAPTTNDEGAAGEEGGGRRRRGRRRRGGARRRRGRERAGTPAGPADGGSGGGDTPSEAEVPSAGISSEGPDDSTGGDEAPADEPDRGRE